MIVLWLLAAHLVGDFILQTRWQAAGKFGWTIEAQRLRLNHVASYCLPFIPIAIVYARGRDGYYAMLFMLLLATLHYLTDSRRFNSTLGDVIVWKAWQGPATLNADLPMPPPSPWTPLPILIDQTLHIVQLAILATLFLR